MNRSQSFPLRLCMSLRHEATRIAKDEQISLNHFISLAVAEKLSRIEQAEVSERRSVPAPVREMRMPGTAARMVPMSAYGPR